MAKTSKKSDAIVEGGCLCGAIRYRAHGSPFNISHCHCTICRRASGAPFVSWTTFAANCFEFTRGTAAQFHSSPKAVRSFCGECGTPLTFQMHEKREEIDVTICSMDYPERFTPEDHIWTRSRLPWIALADGLPTFAKSRRLATASKARVRRGPARKT